MTYLLITKSRKCGAKVLLVAPAGAEASRFLGKGESLLSVAKVRQNEVSVRPCKSGSAAVLAH